VCDLETSRMGAPYTGVSKKMYTQFNERKIYVVCWY
jgi:hypothetical protein